MRPNSRALTAVVIGLLLGFGILTLWVRAAWAQAAVQAGFALFAIPICLSSLFGSRTTWARGRLPVLLALLAAAAVWAAMQAATGLSVSPWRSWNAARDWAVYAAAAALTGWAFSSSATLRRLALTSTLVFTLILSAEAVLQLFTSEGRVFWIFASGFDADVLGPFVYRNRFAQFIELVFPIALWRAAVEPRHRALYLTAAAILFSSVVAAASRVGFLLLLLETAVVLAVARRRMLIERKEAFVLGGQAAALLLLWSALSGWTQLGSRLFGLDPFDDKRLPILHSTLAMIASRPLGGWGLGAWPLAYPAFATFDPGVFVNQAHNDWLQWAAEGGVWFVFIPLAAAALTLRPALRSGWGIGLIAVFLHGAVDYPMQQVPVFATLLWAFAGFLVGERCRPGFATPEITTLRRPLYNTMSRITSILLLTLFAAAAASAQSRPGVPWGPMGDAGAANLPGQRIGANDLLAVSVYDAPELTRTVRVSDDGYLRLPMVTRRLKAAGLLPNELEIDISGLLIEEGLFVKPVVTVTVAEYNSRPIAVAGAVRRPTTFQSIGRVTLLDAIARAEGLGPEAGPEILVSRLDPDSGQRRTERVTVRELMDAASPERNLILRGGEEIRVPEARRIYVTGNVKHPGSFSVREGADMTVMKALALAEGLSPFTQKLAYIYRPVPGGPKQEIPVELSRIIQRKSEDVVLQPDDVLYVPEDRGKRNTIGVLEKAAGFASSTASGLLIFGH